MEIDLKLKKLREKYVDKRDQMMIDDIESLLRKKLKQSDFAQNDFAKMIVEDAEKRVVDIDFLLSNDQKLTDIERARLFAEKEVHKFYLSRFGSKNADSYIASLGRFLDEKLED